MKPQKKLLIGFSMLIILGAGLLFLPLSAAEGQKISFLDAFFVSASAICVTGLCPFDTALVLSPFGQTVLAVLIQLGGLGFASVAVFLLLTFRRDVSHDDRSLVRSAYGSGAGRSYKGLLKQVFAITFTMEILGAAVSYVSFSRVYEPSKALGLAVFHSISAFNNAGFDLLGSFKSLADFHGDVMLNITTSVLIICGGLGFVVYSDIFQSIRQKLKLSFLSKIVLSTTAALLLAGTVLLYFSGSNLSWLESFFASVSSRTAGFSTVDQASLSTAGKMITMVLMFIGASPGSTGGGIKTTTFFTLLIAMKAIVSMRQSVAFKRCLSDKSVKKAICVILFALIALVVAIWLLCLYEPEMSLESLSFEAVSAFATVGLSLGITGSLGIGSKIVLIFLMFIGRVGPLTVASLLSGKETKVGYMEEDVIIG